MPGLLGRGISKDAEVNSVIFMVITSKYAMNVLVSSTHYRQTSKCLSDSTGAHHVSSFIPQTQRASFQKTMQRFRDRAKIDSHWQVD